MVSKGSSPRSYRRVLIVGASGFIGNALWNGYQRLGSAEILGTCFQLAVSPFRFMDVTDEKGVRDILDRFRPDLILHPAYIPNVDYCEQHPEETDRVNVRGSIFLGMEAVRVGAKFVFFSSDYVFNGRNGPYKEDDATDPVCVYGRQKRTVETWVEANLDDYLIVRTTVVYGWERRGKNFVMALLQRLRRGEPMRVPLDQVGSPTFVNNLAEAVMELLRRDAAGLYHVVGPVTMDRYAFSCLAARTFELDEGLIVPVLTSDLGQTAPRPMKAGMIAKKAESLIETSLLAPEEGLRRMKAEEKACIPT